MRVKIKLADYIPIVDSMIYEDNKKWDKKIVNLQNMGFWKRLQMGGVGDRIDRYKSYIEDNLKLIERLKKLQALSVDGIIEISQLDLKRIEL